MLNVLVIGATGFVGRAIVRHLLVDGEHVAGLARSDRSVTRLGEIGAAAVHGDLEQDPEAVIAAARDFEKIVFAAQVPPAMELGFISALLDAVEGSDKTFLFLSGSGVLGQRTGGAWSGDSFAENDAFIPEPLAAARVDTETLVRAAAGRGIRAMVVRPPLIWGPEDHGHVPMTYRSVAVAGAACYVGDGLATYGNVHVDDVAELLARALAFGNPGSLYHCVAGEIPNRWIAEAVAKDLGVPVRSVTPADATEIWGEFGALIMGMSSRIRDAASRRSLGWSPRKTDMLSEIGELRLRALASPATRKE